MYMYITRRYNGWCKIVIIILQEQNQEVLLRQESSTYSWQLIKTLTKWSVFDEVFNLK